MISNKLLQERNCQVPFCSGLKTKFKNQQQKNQRKTQAMLKRRMANMNQQQVVPQQQQQSREIPANMGEVAAKGPRTPNDHQGGMMGGMVGASPVAGYPRKISSKMPQQSPVGGMMSPHSTQQGEPYPKRFKPSPQVGMATNMATSQAMMEATRAQIIAADQARPQQQGGYQINGHYMQQGRIPVGGKPHVQRGVPGSGMAMIRSQGKPGGKPYYTSQQPMIRAPGGRRPNMMRVSVCFDFVMNYLYFKCCLKK